MSEKYTHELEISEQSYKQAVLAVKLLEAAGDARVDVSWLHKQAETCLTSDTAARRTFGLHMLRFLYKNGKISIGWLSKRRIRGLLRADPSQSVRLAAFDLLGAILTKTGSKSGVHESDYSTILDFRQKMLARSPRLREYESSGVRDAVKRLTSCGGIQVTVARIIGDMP